MEKLLLLYNQNAVWQLQEKQQKEDIRMNDMNSLAQNIATRNYLLVTQNIVVIF